MMGKMPWSSDQLVNMYEYTSSGHFFDTDTMRFFKSKVTSNFRRLDDRTALFITTEKGPNGARAATVRLATIESYTRKSDDRECFRISINTIRPFNELTLAKAKTVMKNYVLE